MKHTTNTNHFTCYYLSVDSKNKFINLNTNEDASSLVEKYSLAKYGSLIDIKFLANMITKSVFQEIENTQSEFRKMLETVKQNDDYIVLMTPGYRNVKSSANIMFDISLSYINTKLAMMNLPIIAKIKLPRLANPNENYASLSEEERKITGLTTDHYLPGHSFYKNNNIHVIYGDDVLITGSSSNKAKLDILSKGAKSFISIYSIIIDSKIALNKPSIEEQLNLSKVTGKLDEVTKEILIQDEFIPVLKSLRLILNKDNLINLEQFLEDVPNHNILKIYIAYVTNEPLQNKKYIKSLNIIKEYLIKEKEIEKNGLLILK